MKYKKQFKVVKGMKLLETSKHQWCVIITEQTA